MSKTETTKMGRPKLPPEKKRSYRATVRLTSEQYRWLIQGARKEGLTLSAHIMRLLEKEKRQ